MQLLNNLLVDVVRCLFESRVKFSCAYDTALQFPVVINEVTSKRSVCSFVELISPHVSGNSYATIQSFIYLL